MTPEEMETLRLFQQQQDMGKAAPRHWPNGRVSGDDDGVLAMAMAVDPKAKIIRLQFAQAVQWLGLDAPGARLMAGKLLDAADKLEKL